MIEEIDAKLEAWAGSVLSGTEIRFDAPHVGPGSWASLYLLQLGNALPTQRSERRPLEIGLRYLVTTGADDPREAHRLLGNLALAALASVEMRVELQAPAPELWVALGVAPRPSFFIDVPLVLERRAKDSGRVRYPVQLRTTLASRLSGTLLTADRVPVAQARVELQGLGAVTYTDEAGRFSFGAVPTVPRVKPLRVTVRGEEQVIQAGAPQRASSDEKSKSRLVIHLDREEA